MCNINVINLQDFTLNKKMFILAGTLGSEKNHDGWGIANSDGSYWKCALAMHFSDDAGTILRKKLSRRNTPILGHVRAASPKVPITAENAHPFSQDGITFVHNGKLTPKEEKDFVVEIEVPDLDKDSKEQFEKDGTKKMKKVSRSDSLIFFEKFCSIYTPKVAATPPTTEEEKDNLFIESLKETMELFYGKFAMVFIMGGKFYIVRGKTANLYYTMRTETADTESKVIGWAINTDKDVLETSAHILSNLSQLDGNGPLYFWPATLLKEETIYKVEGMSVKILGEIKENSAPSTYTYKGGATNPTVSGGNITSKKATTDFEKNQEMVCEFMRAYSLHPSDIQNIMFVLYKLSTLEIRPAVLEHFTKKAIPLFHQLTKKDIKKALKKALNGQPFREYRYDFETEYPWFMNSKPIQLKLVKKIEESK